MLATFWPQSTTLGMPPPGFTEPPTKNRFGIGSASYVSHLLGKTRGDGLHHKSLRIG